MNSYMKDITVADSRSFYAGEDREVTFLLDYLVDNNIASFDLNDDRMDIYSYPYLTWGKKIIVGKIYDNVEFVFLSITVPAPPQKSSKRLMGWGSHTQISFEGLEGMHTDVLKKIGNSRPNAHMNYLRIQTPSYGGINVFLNDFMESANKVINQLGEKYAHLLPKLMMLSYSGIYKINDNGTRESVKIPEKALLECLSFIIVETPLNRVVYYWEKGIDFKTFRESEGTLNEYPEEWLNELYG